MLESFKRLLKGRADDADHADVIEWAKRRSFGFKRARHLFALRADFIND